MKPVTLKPIEIGYGDEKIVLFPRMFSVAEQQEVSDKLTDVADTDTGKYQKEFEICRAALDEFSASPAAKLVKVKGEFKHEPVDGGLNAHFATRTDENERIVREAYQLYINQARPDSRFL